MSFKNTKLVCLWYMQVEMSNRQFMCMDLMSEKKSKLKSFICNLSTAVQYD